MEPLAVFMPSYIVVGGEFAYLPSHPLYILSSYTHTLLHSLSLNNIILDLKRNWIQNYLQKTSKPNSTPFSLYAAFIPSRGGKWISVFPTHSCMVLVGQFHIHLCDPGIHYILAYYLLNLYFRGSARALLSSPAISETHDKWLHGQELQQAFIETVRLHVNRGSVFLKPDTI